MSSVYKILQQSLANPVKLVPVNYGQPARMETKNFDMTLFCSQFKGWENSSKYSQKYRHDDETAIQFHSNSDKNIVLKLVDKEGRTMKDYGSTLVKNTFTGNNFNITGVAPIQLHTSTFIVSFADIADGTYFLTATVPFDTTGDSNADENEVYVSEPILVTNNLYGTILLDYCSPNIIAFDTYFGSWVFRMRIEGDIEYASPDSVDTQYNDEYYTLRLLNSYTFRKFNLIVGGVAGIPAWLIDKINIAVGCKSLRIDSGYYTKGEGAKFTITKGDKRYWAQLELRESDNYRDQTSVILSGLTLMTLPNTRSALRNILVGATPYYMAYIINPNNYGGLLYYLNTTFRTTAGLQGTFVQQGNKVVYIQAIGESYTSMYSVVLSKVISFDKQGTTPFSVTGEANFVVMEWADGTTSGAGSGVRATYTLSHTYTAWPSDVVRMYHSDTLYSIDFTDTTVGGIGGTMPTLLESFRTMDSGLTTFDFSIMGPCVNTLLGVRIASSPLVSILGWGVTVFPVIGIIDFGGNMLSQAAVDAMLMSSQTLCTRNPIMRGPNHNLALGNQSPPAPPSAAGNLAKSALTGTYQWVVLTD